MRVGRADSAVPISLIGSIRAGATAGSLASAALDTCALSPKAASKNSFCAKVRRSGRDEAGRGAVGMGPVWDDPMGRGKRATFTEKLARP